MIEATVEIVLPTTDRNGHASRYTVRSFVVSLPPGPGGGVDSAAIEKLYGALERAASIATAG